MPTGRDSRKEFICKFCERQFARLEHLQRHTRTHTKEKPCKCPCGRSFARIDLLRRHTRLAHDGQSPSPTSTPIALLEQQDRPAVTQSEAPSNSINLPVQILVSGQSPQSNHASEAVHNLRPQPNHIGQGADVVQVHAPNNDVPPPTSYSSVIGYSTTTSVPEYQYYNQFDPLQDFSNFIDNAGLMLDCDGFNFFNFQLTAEEVTTPNDRFWDPNSTARVLEHRSIPENMPLPSFDQGPPRSHDLDGHNSLQADDIAFPEAIRSHSHDQSSWTISEERRRRLKHTLGPFQHVLQDFRLPSHITLTRYYRSFVEQFHKHYPLVHVATLRIDECPPEMALIIAAIGAQYRFESRNGLSLYKASKAIAFIQMKEREQRAQGPHFFKPSYLPSPSISVERRHSASPVPDVVNDTQPTSQSRRIDMIRTLIMLIAFASWDWNAELLRDAFGLQGTLARCVREDGLHESPSPTDDQDWHDWIQVEGVRRTKLIAYAYLNVQTLAYNLPPVILNNEVELQLTCSAGEWDAKDLHEWQNARKHRKGPVVYFQDALHVLLDRSQSLETQRMLSHLSLLSHFILLQALIQRICLIRQLNFPKGAPLRAGDLEELEISLQKWKTAWQRAPGSSLDVQNPDGPLPFTSMAFLSLASVRLHTDLGPYRQLDARDPTHIAAALYDAPAPKRSPRLITALLHATHALSLPVKTGVKYVSRSQMFFWSCQHSLCGLESAVFLSKWLQSIAATSHLEPLTTLETTLVDWVRSLVEETQESVDPEELGITTYSNSLALKPCQLSTIVLRIWAGVFSGNTMWVIINQIGTALKALAERIEHEGLPHDAQ